LGLADFYCRFIEGFSKVARPLTALTAFNWAEAARSALVTSKHLFTVAPILVHFHPEKPTVVETDASDSRLARFYRKFRRPRDSIRWLITRGNSSQPI
jgi:hypothetical protein